MSGIRGIRARRVLVAAAMALPMQLLLGAPPAQAWNCDAILGPETCDFIYGIDDGATAFVFQTVGEADQAVDEQRARVVAEADEAYATVRCYASGECQP